MESELSPKQDETQIQQIQQQEVMGREGAFCKYNEATERCIYNPDANATANDEECYKTEKNRCASKKKKMRKIKINPKKVKEVQEDAAITVEMEAVSPVKKKIKIIPNKKLNNDFLYPDLNDENFNIKIS